MKKLWNTIVKFFTEEEQKLEDKMTQVHENLFTKYPHWDSNQAPFYE